MSSISTSAPLSSMCYRSFGQWLYQWFALKTRGCRGTNICISVVRIWSCAYGKNLIVLVNSDLYKLSTVALKIRHTISWVWIFLFLEHNIIEIEIVVPYPNIERGKCSQIYQSFLTCSVPVKLKCWSGFGEVCSPISSLSTLARFCWVRKNIPKMVDITAMYKEVIIR